MKMHDYIAVTKFLRKRCIIKLQANKALAETITTKIVSALYYLPSSVKDFTEPCNSSLNPARSSNVLTPSLISPRDLTATFSP